MEMHNIIIDKLYVRYTLFNIIYLLLLQIKLEMK